MRHTSAPTPFQDLNSVLAELVGSVIATLGTGLAGAYLQGSFAVGGFDEHSDVDFVFVTEAEPSSDEVAALQRVHARVYDLDCEWAKHLEGAHFPRAVLYRAAGRGRPVWYLEHGSNALALSEHCNTVVVRWVLRECGVGQDRPRRVVDRSDRSGVGGTTGPGEVGRGAAGSS